MFKVSLSAKVSTGLDLLKSLGLTAEASMADRLDDIEEYADVLVSAHAPASKDDLRLNVAATDVQFRRESIDYITQYIARASKYPKVKQVNIHFAPRRWVEDKQTRGQEGKYGLMIDAAREISEFAGHRGIEIVMENATAKWTGIEDDVAADQVDWSDRNMYFGTAPEEWIQICTDVDRSNVGLCLDSSHVCTYAQLFSGDSKREQVALSFLDRPDLIRHVHWSDNYLYDPRGRNDSHLSVGMGTMPIEMHRRIKRLNATFLLEHFYTVEELKTELEYIEHL